MNTSRLLVVGLCAGRRLSACTKTAAPASPTTGVGTLTAPTATSPNDQAQLASLRPTLSVTNSPAGGTGTRTYEFQVSDKSDFSSTSSPGSFPVLARQTGIPEGSGHDARTRRTSICSRRHVCSGARACVQGNECLGVDRRPAASTRPSSATTVRASCMTRWYSATRSGRSSDRRHSSVARGSRLNNGNAYVRYQLAQPLSAGEFSLEIAGLHPNGPGAKLKLFEMSDSTNNVYNSPWLFTVQYPRRERQSGQLHFLQDAPRQSGIPARGRRHRSG